MPKFECQDQEDTGSEQSLTDLSCSPPPCPPPSPVLKARKKKVKPLDMNIIRSLSVSRKRLDFPMSENASPVTGNSQDLMQQTNTSGKKIPGFLALNSLSGINHSKEILKQIGLLSRKMLSKEELTTCPQMSLFAITIPSKELLQIILFQLQWSALAMSIGAGLELERVEKPGMKAVWILILKIQELNGGAATDLKKLLLLMNFEGPLTSHICFDGWTVTQYQWKLKVDRFLSMPKQFTSPPTKIRECGILT